MIRSLRSYLSKEQGLLLAILIILVTIHCNTDMDSVDYIDPVLKTTSIQNIAIKDTVHSELTVHDPILIKDNAEFISVAEKEEWFGDGSVENPFIIQNLNISVTDPDHLGIQFTNVDLYFEIKNCLLQGPAANRDEFYGMYFTNVKNGKIHSNHISNISYGIYLQSSTQITLINNTVEHDRIGIFLSSSTHILLEHNKFHDLNSNGIHLVSSDNNIIKENTFTNCYSGIFSAYSENNSISRNTIQKCNEGIRIYFDTIKCSIVENQISASTGITLAHDCSDNLISKNIVSNGDFGMSLSDGCDNNTISMNSIHHHLESGIIINYPFVISPTTAPCSNNHITWNNITVNYKHGITAWYITHNFISYNNFTNNLKYGIHLQHASLNYIERNVFIRNSLSGEQAYDADNPGTPNKFSENYWSNWQSPDANNDGIVDLPYPIAGNCNNTDTRPVTTYFYSPSNTDSQFDSNIKNTTTPKITPSFTSELTLLFIIYCAILRKKRK